MIIYVLLHLRNVQADRQTTPGSQIDTELRQAMSGQVLQQLALGELDVGFYLATAEELKKPAWALQTAQIYYQTTAKSMYLLLKQLLN